MSAVSSQIAEFHKVQDQNPLSSTTLSVVITGHRGFLGSAVANRLDKKNYQTCGIGVTNEASTTTPVCRQEYELELPNTRLDKIVQELRPDALIHCAGTADVAASFHDPPTDYRRNVETLASVLESLRNYAPNCHLVLLSSAAVYGNPRTLPVAESERCIPISPYGCHKLLGEQLVDDYVTEHSMKATVFRIFSAYGNGLRRQVIYDLCKKLHDDTKEHVELFGSGEESRDFIHANDIAAAVEHVITQDLTGIYNLATGFETTIFDLASRLRDLSGREVELKFTGKSRTGDPHRWQADTQKLRATGFTPTIPLDDGLRSYLNWYRQTEMN